MFWNDIHGTKIAIFRCYYIYSYIRSEYSLSAAIKKPNVLQTSSVLTARY